MASKPLFPVSVVGTQQKPTSLFPAFSGTAAPSDGATHKSSLDWLTNSSFKGEEAVLIHHINRARLDEETSVPAHSQSSSEESEKEKSAKKRPTQEPVYRLISDEESSDEPPAKRHKKKKRKEKREKHKRKREYKGKDDTHRVRGHKDDKSERRKEKEKPIPEGTPGGKVFIEGMPSTRRDILYRLDRKPDSDNLRYLELYKMHIARYRRYGNGCLGLPTSEILFLEGVKRKDRKKSVADMRYYVEVKNMKSLKEEKDEPTVGRVIEKQRRSKFDKAGEVISAFIPINSTPPDAKNVTTNPLGIYDAATTQYLEGKPSAEQKIIQEKFDDQESDLNGGFHDNSILSKTADFNKHLQEHPKDIAKWLEFVEFQNEAVCADMDQGIDQSDTVTDERRKKPSRILVLEIKNSIIDEALKKNPSSIRLKMARLELCADQWEPAKLDQEWEKLVFTHPNNPQIWWQRLLHLQSAVSLFSVTKLVKAYAKCLKMLTSIRDGTFLSHPPRPHLEDYILAIFQQLIRVLLQAGHTEKATALLQATVEVNLFCPEVLHTASRADKLQFLDSFWDSAMPRSGETGALGFASWIERKGAVSFCSMYSQEAEVAAEDEAVKDVSSRCEGWLALEQSRGTRHLFPWRPDTGNGETEEDCEDLERVVMIDDISSCVVIFKSELCRIGLITTYIQVLGVKVTAYEVSVDKVIQRSLRSSLDNLSQIFPCPELENAVLFSPPLELMYQTAANLLLQVQTAKIFSGHPATFINLALMEIRKQHLGVKQKAGGLSGKEWKSLCKELRKNAKNVLKEEANRNNLLLWEQYVDLEWVLGSPEDARRVLHTALSMTPSLTIGNSQDTYRNCVTCKLYRHYVEVELGLHVPSRQLSEKTAVGDFGVGSEKAAVYVLASLAARDQFIPPDGSGLTPATLILRARNAYQSTLEVLLLEQGDLTTWSHGAVLRILPQAGTLLAHWTVCFALFQYLTVGIRSALAIFEQVQVKMQTFVSPLNASDTSSASSECFATDLYLEDSSLYYQTVYEDLLSAQLKLLKRHTSANIVPLSLLRTPLQHYLRVRPDSPLLLHMYTDLEAATNIVGRLRRSLYGLATSCETPLVWVYGTLSDMMRRQKLVVSQKQLIESETGIPEWILPTAGCAVGSQHQLRAWLERAINHHTGRHSVLLWRLYFNFEVAEGKSLKAKSVYYRGIAQCPAAKALCMDYARVFPQHLEEVTDLMLEKELRLRTPLEEVDTLLPEFIPRPAPFPENENDELLEDRGTLLDGEGMPLDGEGKSLDGEGKSLDGEGKSLDGRRIPLGGGGIPLDEVGMPLKDRAMPLDGGDISLNWEGKPLDGEDTPLDEEGTPLYGEDTPLDVRGTSLNQIRPMGGDADAMQVIAEGDGSVALEGGVHYSTALDTCTAEAHTEDTTCMHIKTCSQVPKERYRVTQGGEQDSDTSKGCPTTMDEFRTKPGAPGCGVEVGGSSVYLDLAEKAVVADGRSGADAHPVPECTDLSGEPLAGLHPGNDGGRTRQSSGSDTDGGRSTSVKL